MPLFALPVERGCGTREMDGAVYVESALCPPGTPGCVPLSQFIVDPPILVDPALGLTAIGVKLIPAPHPQENVAGWDPQDPVVLADPERTVWHILDWVGSEHYPNVQDFYQEALFFGLSRRLSRTLDFHLLGPHSRWIGAHRRARMLNYHDLFSPERPPQRSCPRLLPDHPALARPGGTQLGETQLALLDGMARAVAGPETEARLYQETQACVPMCAHAWWHDLDPDKLVPGHDQVLAPMHGWQQVIRRLPSTRYTAYQRPAHFVPDYGVGPAIFLSVPIGRLVVTAGETADDSLARAQMSGLRVDLVEQ